MNSEILAAKLKQMRLERDMTLNEVGAAIGITGSAVYRIENSLVIPNERTMYKITRAFPELFANKPDRQTA